VYQNALHLKTNRKKNYISLVKTTDFEIYLDCYLKFNLKFDWCNMKLNQAIVEHASLIHRLRRHYVALPYYRRGFHAGIALAAKSKNPIEMYRADSVANGSNAVYIEKLFSMWDKDPTSVNPVSVKMKPSI